MEFTLTELHKTTFTGSKLPIERDAAIETDAETNPKKILENKLPSVSSAERIVITDSTDADGLGCAVLYKHKWGESVSIIPSGYGRWPPHPLRTLVEVSVRADDGVPIYITDIGQNAADGKRWVKALAKIVNSNPVFFRDHHETPDFLRDNISSLPNIEYVHDTTKSATAIVHEVDYPGAPEYLKEFVELTNARDLYLTDTEEFTEGELLTNAAFWLPFEEYISAAVEYGPNLLEHSEYGDVFASRRNLSEQKLNLVMKTRTENVIHGVSFGIVFGDCYHSEAGRRLLEKYDNDIAAIIKPNGKVSWRSTEEYPYCQQLAEKFDGGGHAVAAGCRPFSRISVNLSNVEDNIDSQPIKYDELAAEKRQELIDAVKEVVSSADAEETRINSQET